MELITKILQIIVKLVLVIKDIITLILQYLFPDGVVHLDWTHLTVGIMLLFASIGLKKGWQYGLATLAALFFSWGVTREATGYLIEVLEVVRQNPLGEKTHTFFPIFLYLFLVVIVMVTFSKMIGKEPKKSNEKISSLLIGLLSGYFFMVLLLDLGRNWISTQFTAMNPLFNLQVSISHLFSLTILSDFTNNPYVAYEDLLTVESVILLLLLLFFWNRLIWSFLNWVDKKLRP